MVQHVMIDALILTYTLLYSHSVFPQSDLICCAWRQLSLFCLFLTWTLPLHVVQSECVRYKIWCQNVSLFLKKKCHSPQCFSRLYVRFVFFLQPKLLNNMSFNIFENKLFFPKGGVVLTPSGQTTPLQLDEGRLCCPRRLPSIQYMFALTWFLRDKNHHLQSVLLKTKFDDLRKGSSSVLTSQVSRGQFQWENKK